MGLVTETLPSESKEIALGVLTMGRVNQLHLFRVERGILPPGRLLNRILHSIESAASDVQSLLLQTVSWCLKKGRQVECHTLRFCTE